MTPPLAWLRCTALAALLALVVGSVGCGGGGGGGGDSWPQGTLEVANDDFSSQIVDSLDVDEVGGPDHFHFNVGLFPGDVFDVGLFPATYDITVYWSDGIVDFYTEDVFDGYVTVLTVSN